MFSKRITIDLKKLGLRKDDLIHLEGLFDEHIGHRGTDLNMIKKAVKRISEEPNRFTVFGGDQLDAINIYDKRFNPDSVTERDIDNQRKLWQELHQDLFDIQQDKKGGVYPKTFNEKVFGLLHGNHEYKVRELTRPYIENHFCLPNDIDFLGSRAHIGLQVVHGKDILSEWSIAIMHGSGGGAPENMFRDMKKNWNADVYLCGHLHQKRYQSEVVYDFDWDEGKSYGREIHLANGGTFQNTLTNEYDGYMDRKNGITGTGIGTATLSFDAYNSKITGHV